jgi:hypothetical protein
MDHMKKAIAVGLIAVGALTLTGCQNVVKNEPATCTVIDKDRSTATDKDGHSRSVFRIYTEGCGDDNATLGLADNLFAGNMNASDMYGRIKVGETYVFQTVGIRNGFFSSFREITRFEKVTVPSPTQSEVAK